MNSESTNLPAKADYLVYIHFNSIYVVLYCILSSYYLSVRPLTYIVETVSPSAIIVFKIVSRIE